MNKQNNEIVVGIDVAKDFSYFIIFDPFGKKLGKAFRVEHKLDSLYKASKKLKEVENQYKCRVVLVMESTGHYSKIPFHFFSQENFTVHMVNPIQSHSIKNISVRKVKNDKVDAERIAILYRLGEIKPSNTATEHEDLKFLTRQYLSLSDEITKFKNSISILLEQMLPGYENVFSDIASPSSLYIISNFQSSEKILYADKEELLNNLSKVARRSKTWATEKYTNLLNVAKSALKLSSSPKTAEFVLKTNITIIKTLVEQQTAVYSQIISLSKQKEDISLIRSIPGIGPLSAAIILSELRDPSA
ncbi:MAG: transposase, partial [Vampirovibrionia bacterium]